jgi:hypothetical protein
MARPPNEGWWKRKAGHGVKENVLEQLFKNLFFQYFGAYSTVSEICLLYSAQ